MDKEVIIIVTDKGWTTILKLNGKVYTEVYEEKDKSNVECIKGDFDLEKDINPELIEVISPLAQHKIMKELKTA